MTFAREERGARIKSCLRATLSIINPTWTGLGSQPGFCSHRLATSSLSHWRDAFHCCENYSCGAACASVLVIMLIQNHHITFHSFFKFLFYT